ncbi:hypothetical protein F5884DRAFT_201432 [Xylogone sp. PMI_703]|nr:hypothetical protein F5884DRAFT_201432 [Xylogone sp. PMI_703]
MAKLPTQALCRVQLPKLPRNSQQIRHASLLRRPHRPYTFTQLVILSDGSSYTQRTTSPLPVLKSTKDTKNHPMWQPSLDSLRNVEQDEAGRLRAFREKFGRGWDMEATDDAAVAEDAEESLMDLISSAAASNEGQNRKK